MSETTALTVYQKWQGDLQTDLKSWSAYIKQLCPEHVTASRIITSIVAYTYTPEGVKLQGCEMNSIIQAALQCAQYGLEPDTPLQLCHIIPYGKQAKLIMGYRGIMQLAMNTGEIDSITSNAVYANDKFSYRDTEGGVKLSWERELIDDRGDFIGVYCRVKKFQSNDIIVTFMSKKEVDAIKMRSPAGRSDSSPWKTDFEAMAIKTVIKRCLKYVPLSPEKSQRLWQAVEQDTNVEAGKPVRPDTDIDDLIAAAGDLAPDMKVEPPAESADVSTEMAEEIKKNGKPKAKAKPKEEAVDKDTGEITEPSGGDPIDWTNPAPERLANCKAMSKEDLTDELNKSIPHFQGDHWQVFWQGMQERWDIKKPTAINLTKDPLYKVIACIRLFLGTYGGK